MRLLGGSEQPVHQKYGISNQQRMMMMRKSILLGITEGSVAGPPGISCGGSNFPVDE
jgi:hypothetical protein